MKTIRKARVESCHEGQARILLLPLPRCGGCAGCGSCGRNPQGEACGVAVPFPLSPGTHIEVEYTTPNLALLSFLVFGLPLGLTLLGAWVGSDAGTDTAMLLGGGTGFVAGFGILWLLNRCVPRLHARARFSGVCAPPGDGTIPGMRDAPERIRTTGMPSSSGATGDSDAATPACAEGHGKAGAGH